MTRAHLGVSMKTKSSALGSVRSRSVYAGSILVHPFVLYVRAFRDGFSDSGFVGGTFSFILFTCLFATVVGILFAPAFIAAVIEGERRLTPLAVVVASIVVAHVTAAVGVSMSGSNSFLLAYPALALLAVILVLVLRRLSSPAVMEPLR